MRDQRSLVLHAFGHGGRFSTRRRTVIQNGFTGLRVEFGHGEQGAGILHIEPTIRETLERGEWREGLKFKHE